MSDEQLPGLPGLPNLASLFAQVEAAQERLEAAAAEASSAILKGSAAGGGVTVQLTGDLEAVSVHIDPDLVDPDDVSLLEDLVLAALRDALGQVSDLQANVAETMSPLGIDLSSVAGFLGGFGQSATGPGEPLPSGDEGEAGD